MPYFDHNATTPLASVARTAWLQAADEAWHNASSPYRAAARVRLRLDAARETLAGLLECDPACIVFTSGATEAAHAIIVHLAATLPVEARLAVNPTEHPCVLAAAGALFPGRITPLPLTPDGIAATEPVGQLIADQLAGGRGAVVVMAANNETGVLQPWRELAKRCTEARVPLVCDAAQWIGKLPAAGLGAVDWVFGSAHKFGGPKGTGFLKFPATAGNFIIRPGGAQERGHRAGTENLPGIAAMVAALVEAEQRKVFLETDRQLLRTTFEQAVMVAVPGVEIVAAGAERLWNTISLIMPHTENHRWVAQLDRRGFEVSTGSACATGKDGPSHVLAALGVSPDRARRVIRVSAGWDTTVEDWTALATAFREVDADLRATANPAVVSG